jgi:hypothetical protein
LLSGPDYRRLAEHDPTLRDPDVLEAAGVRQSDGTKQVVEAHPSNTSMASEVGLWSLIGRMSCAHAVSTM